MAALPLTRQDLISVMQEGFRPKFLFFWGHTPKQAGVVDKSCLSQWFPAPFVVEGHRYATAEHWMMAEKARLFGDEAALARILVAPSAMAAKKLGREVAGFDPEIWAEASFERVVAGNVHKFGQNPELGQFLAGTGQRLLVEASPRDRIWGIGLAQTSARAMDPAQWNGDNKLGFALVEARRRLVEG